MTSTQSTVDYILEQIAEAGDVSARKMFGEYGVYCDGKMVALVCDDQLFVRPTTSGLRFIGNPIMKPPYPKAKPYFCIPGDKWEDAEWLSALIKRTAPEVPLSVKKPKKRPRK